MTYGKPSPAGSSWRSGQAVSLAFACSHRLVGGLDRVYALAYGTSRLPTADLSRITALRVIARTSAAAARQQTRDLKWIARMLDVR